MTAAQGVCQIIGDRNAWWNFTLGLAAGCCVTAVIAASIIATIRHGRREWTP